MSRAVSRAEFDRRRTRERRDCGLCKTCGRRDAQPGRTRCLPCGRKDAAYAARRYRTAVTSLCPCAPAPDAEPRQLRLLPCELCGGHGFRELVGVAWCAPSAEYLDGRRKAGIAMVAA